MSSIPTMDGIQSRTIDTKRLRVHYLERGPSSGQPVLFVHGNASSATFYEELMLAMPDEYRALAIDMRGYGDTETLPIDATRGARDGSDDIAAFLDALGITGKVHLVGWSLGGGWVMQFQLDHPERVRTVTLVAPVSPYGFGGTKDVKGTAAFDDCAASGAGGVSPEFPQRVKDGDRSSDSNLSPRSVMNAFYFKPPFKAAREEEFVSSILSMKVSEGNYPGDAIPSPNWPSVAPGTRGVLNAFAPRYYNTSAVVHLEAKAPILWVRGADDQVVSNTSFWDVATLGQFGVIPGWPGADVLPPQPMIDQTRAVFDRYRVNGGEYREVVFENCAHAPHIEHAERFQKEFFAFLGQH